MDSIGVRQSRRLEQMVRHVLRTSLIMGALAMGLSACNSNSMMGVILTDSPFSPLRVIENPKRPTIQATNKIYYAPAQTYDLDLSAPAFVGKLKLQQSCTPEGNSLTINDQIGRFYRIDVINLKNNPKFPDADGKSVTALSEQIYQFYLNLYKAYPQGSVKLVKSQLGKSGYASMSLPNHLSPIGLLIAKHQDYAYVLQHQQKYFNEKDMQYVLSEMANNMQIPGREMKKSGSMLALGIDLQSTPEQINDWKKIARCS
jgi:hypothetical protein